ncbi:MAG: hypothetical protein J0H41_13210 [Rhizobiales bacterium]|nr:hypothetical protein [Hyphomicrobiales bacterium]
MSKVRNKGLKRYRSKGRWYAYHRATGKRITAEFGTAELFQALGALEARVRSKGSVPGTLGALFESYRRSVAFTDLAPATREGYLRIINLIAPLHEMPSSD